MKKNSFLVSCYALALMLTPFVKHGKKMIQENRRDMKDPAERHLANTIVVLGVIAGDSIILAIIALIILAAYQNYCTFSDIDAILCYVFTAMFVASALLWLLLSYIYGNKYLKDFMSHL